MGVKLVFVLKRLYFVQSSSPRTTHSPHKADQFCLLFLSGALVLVHFIGTAIVFWQLVQLTIPCKQVELARNLHQGIWLGVPTRTTIC